jgi:hypothetical protein
MGTEKHYQFKNLILTTYTEITFSLPPIYLISFPPQCKMLPGKNQ